MKQSMLRNEVDPFAVFQAAFYAFFGFVYIFVPQVDPFLFQGTPYPLGEANVHRFTGVLMLHGLGIFL